MEFLRLSYPATVPLFASDLLFIKYERVVTFAEVVLVCICAVHRGSLKQKLKGHYLL